jgi:hypothetical protein
MWILRNTSQKLTTPFHNLTHSYKPCLRMNLIFTILPIYKLRNDEK